jgi:hypothetical protein
VRTRARGGKLGTGARRDAVRSGPTPGRGAAISGRSLATAGWPEVWPTVVGIRWGVDLLFLLYILI